MSDDPDELAVALRELAEREVRPAGDRFQAGLRQAVRWEQGRRRTQRRWLIAAGCLTALLAALGVSLALPATARYLPLPVGSELRRLDDRTSTLQAKLTRQAAADVMLRRQLAAQAASVEKVSLRRPAARHRATSRHRAATTHGSYGGWASQPAVSPGPSATRPIVAAPLASISSIPSPSATPVPSPSSP